MAGLKWWQAGVVYELYPRSFKDSDGDGIGDLGGILEKLDYLAWLGTDILWIAPIFPSPMVDIGYDVSNSTDIDPSYGDLATFDRLIEATRRRRMKVILDFVPNHTSDRHPWFQESRSSRDNPKRDWYLWRDAKADGSPPNNWLSTFGGSAWEWDEGSGQFYYHAFATEQPDLNWRNPDVVATMHDVLRFWLDRGVAGFRVDALERLVKDDRFRDNPKNPDFEEGRSPDEALLPVHSRSLPENHEVVRGLRRVVDEYDDRVLLGESYSALPDVISYHGARLDEIHLPLNFQLIVHEWRCEVIAEVIEEYRRLLPEGAWPNWVLGNHDMPRVASRIGLAQARVAALLSFTLGGTPVVYYGDEIGLENRPVDPDRATDPREKNMPGRGLGRDPFRSPMQWDDGPHAGFTNGEPWLPVAANASEVNVETQSKDPISILSLYRRLIALRRTDRALLEGDLRLLSAAGDALVYDRRHADRRLLIAANFAEDPHMVLLPPGTGGRILISTHLDRDGEPVRDEMPLRGDEAVVVELEPQADGGG